MKKLLCILSVMISLSCMAMNRDIEQTAQETQQTMRDKELIERLLASEEFVTTSVEDFLHDESKILLTSSAQQFYEIMEMMRDKGFHTEAWAKNLHEALEITQKIENDDSLIDRHKIKVLEILARADSFAKKSRPTSRLKLIEMMLDETLLSSEILKISDSPSEFSEELAEAMQACDVRVKTLVDLIFGNNWYADFTMLRTAYAIKLQKIFSTMIRINGSKNPKYQECANLILNLRDLFLKIRIFNSLLANMGDFERPEASHSLVELMKSIRKNLKYFLNLSWSRVIRDSLPMENERGEKISNLFTYGAHGAPLSLLIEQFKEENAIIDTFEALREVNVNAGILLTIPVSCEQVDIVLEKALERYDLIYDLIVQHCMQSQHFLCRLPGVTLVDSHYSENINQAVKLKAIFRFLIGIETEGNRGKFSWWHEHRELVFELLYAFSLVLEDDASIRYEKKLRAHRARQSLLHQTPSAAAAEQGTCPTQRTQPSASVHETEESLIRAINIKVKNGQNPQNELLRLAVLTRSNIQAGITPSPKIVGLLNFLEKKNIKTNDYKAVLDAKVNI